jgi:TPR repeat protein
MKKLLIILLLSSSFISSINADYKVGYDSLTKGDYKTAYEEFLALAIRGDNKAQYRLAQLYRDGIPPSENSSWELKKDVEKFIFWHTKASEQGTIESSFVLGSFYMKQGDIKNSLMWYKKTSQLFFKDK